VIPQRRIDGADQVRQRFLFGVGHLGRQHPLGNLSRRKGLLCRPARIRDRQ
jgi:hypothetical protein